MSLTTNENGAVTLSKARHDVCMSIVWELEALAYVLPTVTTNSDPEAFMSGLVVRGIAARFLSLSEVLTKAIFDDAEKTSDLEKTVFVSQRSGCNST